MSALHTPGPWRVFTASRSSDILGVGDSQGGSVAHLWRDGVERKANASLIAAAPQLLDALCRARSLLRRAANTAKTVGLGNDLNRQADELDVAIASATGAA